MQSACKRHDESPASPTDDFNATLNIAGDGLSPEDADFMDSISVDISHDDIFFSDGTPKYPDAAIIQQGEKVQFTNPILTTLGTNKSLTALARDLLIDDMWVNVVELSAEKIFVTHPDDGELSPKHMGYAYSYGQRDYGHRLPPPDGNLLHRKYSVFGTDCSGLMINLSRNAGVQISDCISITFEGALRQALAKKTAYTGMRVCNLGALSPDQFKNCDYIIWPGKRHIGMLSNSTKGWVVFSSHGTPVPLSLQDQMNNWGPKRGVHAISLSKALSNPYWKTGYQIVRIVAIGDQMLGGSLFYLDNTNQHGLIAATQDQSTNYTIPHDIPETGNVTTTGNESAIYSGLTNTQKLISSNTAAKGVALLCSNYKGGGYSDWYLPSSLELAELYKQKDIVGGFLSNYYASSTWIVNPDPDYYGTGKGATFIAISFLNFSNGSSYSVDGNARGGAPVYPPSNIRAVRKF